MSNKAFSLNMLTHYLGQDHLVVPEIIPFVDNLILHASQHAASDIHIEPYKDVCRIRYRQDGLLYQANEIPADLATRIATRLKVMAKLDIAERRLPQDGRFQLNEIDIRINTCPTLFGEKIVLRLLNTHHISLEIDNLAFTKRQKEIFLKTISQSQGLILVTGPTGSGKTTTLYSALHYLNKTEKNISTVEDPIEIQLTGINQVNVNTKINLHFSTVLRTLLRQDPDIIMIGEIRDPETADIAIQAAQTGHLVLSTLHTNSAIETLTRLHAMKILAYNLAGSLSLIIAQRLIRTLCAHCKQIEPVSVQSALQLEIDPRFLSREIYRAQGCSHCLHGYTGRIAIYEFLPITESIATLIALGSDTMTLMQQAKQENFISLKESGIEKVLQGITSFAEINRVLLL